MSYTDLFTAELESKVREGAKVYDVRERDEYTSGHIPGAVNIPLSELVGREDEIQFPAIIVCQAGGRSARAATHLAGQGRTDIMNLLGGTGAWLQEGREVRSGEQP
ncbi:MULTISPECIES: rhodanese-like domain-containing protein [Deinococcus]|uniref:Rhodanese-like domain-containing protein n=1 Tax=Deinococcus cavernae TaxID=2320857 RepID=A0A418V756_9DEIO|nr:MULTISPECIES: rhodanese-like domain-containing protein [Deinococcus]RJF71895.1 rhodanese-like domain-containing protein [Deinococcus cavernae]